MKKGRTKRKVREEGDTDDTYWKAREKKVRVKDKIKVKLKKPKKKITEKGKVQDQFYDPPKETVMWPYSSIGDRTKNWKREIKDHYEAISEIPSSEITQAGIHFFGPSYREIMNSQVQGLEQGELKRFRAKKVKKEISPVLTAQVMDIQGKEKGNQHLSMGKTFDEKSKKIAKHRRKKAKEEARDTIVRGRRSLRNFSDAVTFRSHKSKRSAKKWAEKHGGDGFTGSNEDTARLFFGGS